MTRAGLQIELERAGYQVFPFPDGSSCLARLSAQPVDAVVCDLYLSGESGPPALPLVTQLAEAGNRVVVHSTWSLDPDVLAALRGGALAFVQKGPDTGPLLQVLRRVLASDPGSDPVLTPEVAAALRRRERFGLTSAEVEVLGYLSQHLTNQEIATIRGVSEETVKTQLASIRSKLGAENRASAVRTAHRHGLIGRWRRAERSA